MSRFPIRCISFALHSANISRYGIFSLVTLDRGVVVVVVVVGGGMWTLDG